MAAKRKHDMAKIPSSKFPKKSSKMPSSKFPKSQSKIPSKKFPKGTTKLAPRKISKASATASKKPDTPTNEESDQDRLATLKGKLKSMKTASKPE